MVKQFYRGVKTRISKWADEYLGMANEYDCLFLRSWRFCKGDGKRLRGFLKKKTKNDWLKNINVGNIN